MMIFVSKCQRKRSKTKMPVSTELPKTATPPAQLITQHTPRGSTLASFPIFSPPQIISWGGHFAGASRFV